MLSAQELALQDDRLPEGDGGGGALAGLDDQADRVARDQIGAAHMPGAAREEPTAPVSEWAGGGRDGLRRTLTVVPSSRHTSSAARRKSASTRWVKTVSGRVYISAVSRTLCQWSDVRALGRSGARPAWMT